MMKTLFFVTLALLVSVSFAQNSASSAMKPNGLKMNFKLLKQSQDCVSCHTKHTPGMVNDWKNSRHAHAGVGCIDCHQVKKSSPMAAQNCKGVKGTNTYITMLVTPKTCAKCHPAEVKEFAGSGHARARKQYIKKKGLHDLMYVHEGQNHPKYSKATEVTGCSQCHGTIIKLDKNRRPTAETWPTAGVGTVWPDGSIGGCAACHTRHKFDIAEARKPDACAACHLGPDHPDIEIFENSKHGHIYKTEGHKYKFDDPPGAWEPGSYRAPTCATCHMSGIGDLTPTHDVSKRLMWNLWAKKSKIRNSKDPMSMLTGDGVKGRVEMKKVCSNCHSSTHTKNFFVGVDNAVNLYNESYFEPAENMRKQLVAKGLVKKNPWKDEFLTTYYYLWHHQGRRARQGSAMGGPDYAHWHGFFELQQDIYKLQMIFEKRVKTGKIED